MSNDDQPERMSDEMLATLNVAILSEHATRDEWRKIARRCLAELKRERARSETAEAERDQARALLKQARGALNSAANTIASLEVDTFGMADDGRDSWPVRDEMEHNLRQVIKAIDEELGA